MCVTTAATRSSRLGAPFEPAEVQFSFRPGSGCVVRNFQGAPRPGTKVTDRDLPTRIPSTTKTLYIARQTTMRLLSMKGRQLLGLALLWAQASSQQTSGNSTSSTTSGSSTSSNVCRVCGSSGNIDNEYRMVSTSFGIFTCGALLGAGIHGNIDPENCDAAKVVAVEKCGCILEDGSIVNQTVQCSICPDGGVVTIPDAIVQTSSGGDSLSCGAYSTMASSGQLLTDQCADLQLYTNKTCGCIQPEDLVDSGVSRPESTTTNETFVCPVCGEGMMSSTPNAIVTLPSRTVRTCQEFEEAAALGRISRQQCGLLKSYVEASCSCIEGTPVAAPTPAPVVSYDCSICGEDMVVTRPSAVVIIPSQPDRTCRQFLRANVLGKINRQQCGLLQPFVQEYCGCIPKSLTEKPTGTPTKAPTIAPTREPVPTASPAPTGWTAQKDGCFDNLMEIYALEKALEDPSENRRYILCSDTTYHLGELRDDGQIINGDAFLMLRPNVMYQCGENGSRDDNCILKGGDFGLISLYGVYEDIYETVHNVRIIGITFESQNLFGAVMEAAGDIQFINCAFKNHGNMAPVLMQWRGAGPSVPVAASRERKLRLTAEADSPLVQFRRRILGRLPSEDESQRRRLEAESTEFSHTVTFKGCVFRGNHVGVTQGFPGIIENSFRSKLNIENCIFQDNDYGEENNPFPFSYAVRSYGPVNLESSCFMDNTFQAHGPVQLFGARHTTLGNYVRTFQQDLTCEFMAVFAARDDTSDAAPVCFDSDASYCPVDEAPTTAPTRGPPTTPPPTVEPVSYTDAPSQTALKKLASGASSIPSVVFSLGPLAGALIMAWV